MVRRGEWEGVGCIINVFVFLLKFLCNVLGDARQNLGVILASLKCSCLAE